MASLCENDEKQILWLSEVGISVDGGEMRQDKSTIRRSLMMRVKNTIYFMSIYCHSVHLCASIKLKRMFLFNCSNSLNSADLYLNF